MSTPNLTSSSSSSDVTLKKALPPLGGEPAPLLLGEAIDFLLVATDGDASGENLPLFLIDDFRGDSGCAVVGLRFDLETASRPSALVASAYEELLIVTPRFTSL